MAAAAWLSLDGSWWERAWLLSSWLNAVSPSPQDSWFSLSWLDPINNPTVMTANICIRLYRLEGFLIHYRIWSSTWPCQAGRAGFIFAFILQKRKWKPNDIQRLAQGYKANRAEQPHLKPGLLVPHPACPILSCLLVQVALWIITHFCLVLIVQDFYSCAPNLHMLEHKIPQVPKRQKSGSQAKCSLRWCVTAHAIPQNNKVRSGPALRSHLLLPHPSASLPQSLQSSLAPMAIITTSTHTTFPIDSIKGTKIWSETTKTPKLSQGTAPTLSQTCLPPHIWDSPEACMGSELRVGIGALLSPLLWFPLGRRTPRKNGIGDGNDGRLLWRDYSDETEAPGRDLGAAPLPLTFGELLGPPSPTLLGGGLREKGEESTLSFFLAPIIHDFKH